MPTSRICSSGFASRCANADQQPETTFASSERIWQALRPPLSAAILLFLAASLQADAISLVPIVSGLDRPVQLVTANDRLPMLRSRTAASAETLLLLLVCDPARAGDGEREFVNTNRQSTARSVNPSIHG